MIGKLFTIFFVPFVLGIIYGGIWFGLLLSIDIILIYLNWGNKITLKLKKRKQKMKENKQ